MLVHFQTNAIKEILQKNSTSERTTACSCSNTKCIKLTYKMKINLMNWHLTHIYNKER